MQLAQRNAVEDWAQFALKRHRSRRNSRTRLWRGDTIVSSASSDSSGKIRSQTKGQGIACAVSLWVAGANIDLISCGPAMCFMYTREKAIRNYSIAVTTFSLLTSDQECVLAIAWGEAHACMIWCKSSCSNFENTGRKTCISRMGCLSTEGQRLDTV